MPVTGWLNFIAYSAVVTESTGSVIVNTAPPPGPEAASMFPPCSRRTVLQMLRPRPVPRPGRLVVKKGSKMCGRIFGGDSGAVVLKYDPYGIGLSTDARHGWFLCRGSRGSLARR